MRRVLTWTTITSGNYDEANGKLQFRNSAGHNFNGDVTADKSVSGTHSILSFSLTYSP